MEPAGYVEHVRDDGEALAAAARQAPQAAVPCCPAWDMTALVGHVTAVHHWVTGILRTGATARPKRQRPDPAATPDAALREYQAGLTELLDALGMADPNALVWNWFDEGPAPARFWHRRMAHETAVHRWDAQAAAGVTQPIEPALAVDGMEEFLSFVEEWLRVRPVEGLAGSLHLHATDVDGEWSLYFGDHGLEHRREHSKADAAIRGPASDLFLWMVNRIAPDSPELQLFGDRGIVDAWRAVRFE